MQENKKKTIFVENLENWIHENCVPRPDPIFTQIENFAKENNFPILSPNSGKILSFLVRLLPVHSILELGTGLGYSTCWFLSSSKKNLEIVSIDREKKNQDYAKNKIETTYPDSNVKFIEKDCLEFLQNTKKFYDLVFVDCDKIIYPEVWSLIQKNIQPKYVAFDNMLWGGRVLLSPETPSEKAIQKIWQDVKQASLNYHLFPCGDGILFVCL